MECLLIGSRVVGAVDIDGKILLSARDIEKFNVSPGKYRTAVRRSPRLSGALGKISLAESALRGGKGYEYTYNSDSPLRGRMDVLGRQKYSTGSVGDRRRGLRRAGRIGDLRRRVDGGLTTLGADGVDPVQGGSACMTRDVV